MFGCEPSNPVLFAASPDVRGTEVVGVQNFADFQADVLKLVRDNLLEAQRAVALFANRRQKEVIFELGASVWLNSVNLSTVHFARAERKLRNPFVGPFKVVERCSEYTYRLELTGKFRRLHPGSLSRSYVEARASSDGRRVSWTGNPCRRLAVGGGSIDCGGRTSRGFGRRRECALFRRRGLRTKTSESESEVVA